MIFVIFVIFMLVIGAPWKILEDGGGDDGGGLLVQLLAIIRAPVRRYISTFFVTPQHETQRRLETAIKLRNYSINSSAIMQLDSFAFYYDAFGC